MLILLLHAATAPLVSPAGALARAATIIPVSLQRIKSLPRPIPTKVEPVIFPPTISAELRRQASAFGKQPIQGPTRMFARYNELNISQSFTKLAAVSKASASQVEPIILPEAISLDLRLAYQAYFGRSRVSRAPE